MPSREWLSVSGCFIPRQVPPSYLDRSDTRVHHIHGLVFFFDALLASAETTSRV